MVTYLIKIFMFSLPALVVFSCFYPYRHRALQAMGLHSSTLHEVGMLFLIVSIFGIFALTLVPYYEWVNSENYIWGDILLTIKRYDWNKNLNLIPFRSFHAYWAGAIIRNVCGNLAMFMPLGFLSSALFRNGTWKRALCIGVGMSLFIEVAQYFIMRASDIDDIILNTTGALCGYWLYRLIGKVWPQVTKKLACQEIQSNESVRI